MSPPDRPSRLLPSVDAFLRLILRSGLLDRDGLQAAVRALPPGGRDDPDAVAAHLVKAGQLSRFQARKLLAGSWQGLVLGPYQLLAPVGRGAMGSVYLVRDGRTGWLLALKVLPPRKAREEDRMLARFRREMELCRRVEHPHVARTVDVGETAGVYFIAMEYIPGRTLHRLVAEDGVVAVPRLARLAAEVCAGLGHAHARGLVHRDLKPGNVMVTPHDHAKVLDLGLALVAGETGDREVVGGQGYVVGTMDYIAPEQIDDPTAVDARADVYALGCTLYYALTGRPPFAGGTRREKMHRHRTEQPTPLMALNPAVPAGFAAVVGRMMAKDPARRYATAAAAADELPRWEAGGPVMPLDRPDDSDYVAAVAELEAAEPVAELLRDDVLDRAAVIADTPHLTKYRGQKRGGRLLAALLRPWVLTGIVLGLVVLAVVLVAVLR